MQTNEPRREKSDARQDAQITKHIEPPSQGGQPFLRCEVCQREVIGRDEGRLLHNDDCPLAGANR